MKKFAFINGNNVLNIVVAEEKPQDSDLGIFVEYNETTNNAVIGGTYNEEKNKFIDIQPHASWVLDTETCIWEAPSAKPETGYYRWDEMSLSWVELVN
jgi:hypothetical protein